MDFCDRRELSTLYKNAKDGLIIKKLDKDTLCITVILTNPKDGQIQQHVKIAADAVFQGRPYTYGKHRYSIAELIQKNGRPVKKKEKKLFLEQYVTYDPNPGEKDATKAPLENLEDWKPGEKDLEAAHALVDTFHAFFAKAQFEKALQLFKYPNKSWAAGLLSQSEAFGRFLGKDDVQITWKANPPNAEPGIFAVIRMTTSYAYVMCAELVVLHKPLKDSDFKILRHERTQLTLPGKGSKTK